MRPQAAFFFASHASGGCLGAAVVALALSCTPEQPQPAQPRPTQPSAIHPPAAAQRAQGDVSLTSQPSVARAEPAEAAKPESPTESLPERLAPLGIGGPVRSLRGVVTSVERQATGIGVAILTRGGNAVDAAVATAFALAVTHPSAGNLAGGGFALLRQGMATHAVDFREDSPARLTDSSFYAMLDKKAKTGSAVGVPGTVAGLLLMHSKFGRLALSEVIQPAEQLAREGYILGLRQHSTLTWAQADLLLDPVARRVFFVNGHPKPTGTKIRRPDLALALSRIRENGRAGFYEGPTALDLVSSLGPVGLITLEDLKNYEAKLREPLKTTYRGTTLLTMPPPSAGGVALVEILGMLNTFDLGRAPSAEALHYFAEASRRAQVERRLFITAPERLAADEEANLRARWLDPATWLKPHPILHDKATPSAEVYPAPPAPEHEEDHTTHLAAVDAEGNSVSVTVTLSASYGTRIFSRETGMALNNSVASFSSSGVNTPKPSVRTISSMAPTLLLAQDETVALGSPGGDTIPSTIALTVLELVDWQKGFQGATASPRLHQGLFPDVLEMEGSHPLAAATIAALKRAGHAVRSTRYAQGDANLAAWIGGEAHAIADTREGGLALGVPRPTAGSVDRAE
jgi:gamma-glutamyltranspeptidase / glutathione hydrolase